MIDLDWGIEEKFTQLSMNGQECTIRHIEIPSSKNGISVLLLPGIGGFAESYVYNMRELAENGFRPIAIDNVGFGGSTVDDEFNFTPFIFAESLAHWINLQDISEFYIVGNSFGGGIALGIWKLLPEKTKGIVLVSTAGFGEKLWIGYRFASLPLINGLFVRMVINPRISFNNSDKSWDSIVYDSTKIPDFIKKRNILYKKDVRIRKAYEYVLKNLVSFTGQKAEITKTIQEIAKEIHNAKIPTMIVWGENDQIIPKEHGIYASELLGSELHIFPECGHLPYLEHVDEFNSILLDFLKVHVTTQS